MLTLDLGRFLRHLPFTGTEPQQFLIAFTGRVEPGVRKQFSEQGPTLLDLEDIQLIRMVGVFLGYVRDCGLGR